MNEAVMDSSAKTPLHLWIVGGLATLWNAFGCYDYVMTQTRNGDYMAMLTEAQRAHLETFPAWMEAAWAIGVWGGMLGALLLLLRSRYAELAFWASLIGLLVGTIYQFGMSGMPAEVRTPAMIAMTAVIWLVAIALLVYAIRMRRSGVLR